MQDLLTSDVHTLELFGKNGEVVRYPSISLFLVRHGGRRGAPLRVEGKRPYEITLTLAPGYKKDAMEYVGKYLEYSVLPGGSVSLCEGL